MLTKELLFGMNLTTLAGFALMGICLILARQHTIRAPVAITLMGAGTALVFLGLYLTPSPTPS